MASWGRLSLYRQPVTARAHDLPARDIDVPPEHPISGPAYRNQMRLWERACPRMGISEHAGLGTARTSMGESGPVVIALQGGMPEWVRGEGPWPIYLCQPWRSFRRGIA
jgi:hypothetical protein